MNGEGGTCKWFSVLEDNVFEDKENLKTRAYENGSEKGK